LPPADRPSLAGTLASAVALTRCLQEALTELKDNEARLIYAEHRVRCEYNRVYDQIEYVKDIVKHSVVLSPIVYDKLVEDARYGRTARACAVAGGSGGTSDAAAYPIARSDGWDASFSRRRRDDDAISVEDSE
jgi:hypothetical protein